MGQITTTQNLVAIKEVRHAGHLIFPVSHFVISTMSWRTVIPIIKIRRSPDFLVSYR